MFSRTYGATVFGLHGNIITVETDISNGLPAFEIVGLAATSVKESKERVRSAIKACGLKFPVSRVTVSRVLGDFDRRGWVRTGYKSLRLLDRPAMEAFLAGGGR